MAPSPQSRGGANNNRSATRLTKSSKTPIVANTSAKLGRMNAMRNAQMPHIDQTQSPKQPSTTIIELATPPETDPRWAPPSINTGWHQQSHEPIPSLPRHVPTPPRRSQHSLERRSSSHERRSLSHHTAPQQEAIYAPFSPQRITEPCDDDIIGAEYPPDRYSSASPVAVPESVKATLYTALGAGRLDPFQVYCKKDLPLYVHEILDHYLHHVCCSFTLAAEGVGQALVMSHIMGHAMSDTLTWYAIILAGVTHYMYVNGDRVLPPEIAMLRLSYKTEAMALIRESIAKDPVNVPESTLFAINTLASHGGALFEKGFQRDRIQDAKAFGAANNVDYYTSIEIQWEHWNMFIKLMRQRGGPASLSHPEGIPGFPPSPGPGCLTTSDVMIAWRNLQCPEFPLVFSTDHVMKLQVFNNDQEGAALSQKLLSGFPTMPKTNMHFKRLTALLKNVRKIIVDFEQYQRGRPQLWIFVNYTGHG